MTLLVSRVRALHSAELLRRELPPVRLTFLQTRISAGFNPCMGISMPCRQQPMFQHLTPLPPAFSGSLALTVRRLRRSQASRRFLRRLIAPRLILLRRKGTKLLVFAFHGYPFPKLQGISLTYLPLKTLARLSRVIIIKTSERLPHSTLWVYLLILNIIIG